MRPLVGRSGCSQSSDTPLSCRRGETDSRRSVPAFGASNPGAPSGSRWSAADYSNKSVRYSERETIGNAEEVYRRFVAT